MRQQLLLSQLAGSSADDNIITNDQNKSLGFGSWDGVNFITPGNIIAQAGINGFVLRESQANQNVKCLFTDWSFWGGTGSGGTIDRNVFLSDTIQDVTVTIMLFAQGTKQDGSEGYSAVLAASFRKDGVADPVQVGATTNLHAVEDSPNSPAVTIGLGAIGTDNIRVTYNSGSGDIWDWTFYAIISYGK